VAAGGVARGWDPEFESALLQGRVVCEPACWRSWTRRGRVRSRSPTPTAERWRRIHSGLSASPFHARPAPSPTLSLGHEDGEHRRESIGAGVEARLTAMIARWTLSSISGQSELWTTLTPFPRIRNRRMGLRPALHDQGEQQRTDIPQRQSRRIGACLVADGRRFERRTL
jgi:hypothetical protein